MRALHSLAVCARVISRNAKIDEMRPSVLSIEQKSRMVIQQKDVDSRWQESRGICKARYNYFAQRRRRVWDAQIQMSLSRYCPAGAKTISPMAYIEFGTRRTPGDAWIKKNPQPVATNSDKYCAFDKRSRVYLFFILHDRVGVESSVHKAAAASCNAQRR